MTFSCSRFEKSIGRTVILVLNLDASASSEKFSKRALQRQSPLCSTPRGRATPHVWTGPRSFTESDGLHPLVSNTLFWSPELQVFLSTLTISTFISQPPHPPFPSELFHFFQSFTSDRMMDGSPATLTLRTSHLSPPVDLRTLTS